MSTYLFTSARLGFREWKISDLAAMEEIFADKEVMEFFPSTLSKDQTVEFITTRQGKFTKNGFCYYAAEIIETNELIGFIGLSKQEYDAGFETPFVDIGWRLKKSSWFKGYATEGAKRSLEYGFKTLKLKTIYAITPSLNTKSTHVMDKIGMVKHTKFIHPSIADDCNLKECLAYKITLEEWKD
jgi:RimJ/RimL family protein N-acetyltransferase